MLNKKYEKIIKAIESCETKEQLSCAIKWINSISKETKECDKDKILIKTIKKNKELNNNEKIK